jgi:hypothetical protein
MGSIKYIPTVRKVFDKLANLRHIVVILCILGVGVGLFFLFFVDTPNELHWPDPKLYYNAAKEVVATGTFSDRMISPGLAYFWGFLMHLIGKSVLLLKLIFVLLIGWFLYSMYLLGKDAFNKKVGILVHHRNPCPLGKVRVQ